MRSKFFKKKKTFSIKVIKSTDFILLVCSIRSIWPFSNIQIDCWQPFQELSCKCVIIYFNLHSTIIFLCNIVIGAYWCNTLAFVTLTTSLCGGIKWMDLFTNKKMHNWAKREITERKQIFCAMFKMSILISLFTNWNFPFFLRISEWCFNSLFYMFA